MHNCDQVYWKEICRKNLEEYPIDLDDSSVEICTSTDEMDSEEDSKEEPY